MDLVLLGILNVVLLVLLLVAFKLIRTGGLPRSDKQVVDAQTVVVDDEELAIRQTIRETIDLRDGADSHVPTSPQPQGTLHQPQGLTGNQSAPMVSEPTMPVYSDPVFTDGGAALPTDSFESPKRRDAGPAPQPPSKPVSLRSLPRSAIVVDSSMNGSGPAPKELLFSIIETLGGIGFRLNKDSADYGLLVDNDGNTASVELSKRSTGTDRIAIAVDSPRAVETLAVLEIWHRSRLGGTDQVRLSARIR